MTSPRAKFLLAVLALVASSSAPLRAAITPPTPTNFFSSQVFVGNIGNGYEAYYLDNFKYFAYAPDTAQYIYKFNFGFLYYFDTTQGNLSSNEAYFYDFTSQDYFYTATNLYPYFYSFKLDSFLYYFEGSNPREFYEFKTSSFIAY